MAKHTLTSNRLPFALWNEDCLLGIPRRVKKGLPTLACFDPPYNIGQPYSDFVDKQTQKAYLDFLCPRVAKTSEYLHPHGSMWIAINDANVSELDVYCKQELGLFPRKKVIWYFTFGQNNSKNFTQSHVTWLYYTKHRSKYIFNHADPAVRIPSARQTVYNDKRANSKGRLPDDFWMLRPQEMPKSFEPFEDCWYFSRVCGTFNAKVKESPNQMPVRMMDRIIRFCSNPGDVVIDSFNGSGSTGEAAITANREYVGFDVSKGCIKASESRLRRALDLRGKNDASAKQLDLFEQGSEK